MRYNSIIIVGPTACGKTGLSIALAKALKTEIVGADSLQIYKDLNIGTAKVTSEEAEGIKHHMIDFLDPTSTYSVNEYKETSTKIISKIIANGKLPIIVGGTGFYVDSLITNNLYGNCPANSEIRAKYACILDEKGKEYIYSILKQIDPITANKLHYNDTKRVIRALEIYESTGKTKSEIDSINKAQSKNNIINPLIIGLDVSDRELLYNKINKRVDIMFGDGLEEEVKKLINSGVTFNNQSMQAIGYKEFSEYLNGNISKDILKEKIKQNTRHYAKRQLTYFRHLNIVKWYKTDKLTNEQIVEDILDLLDI